MLMEYSLDGDSTSMPLGDVQSFENEWLEVEVRHPTSWTHTGSNDVPNSPTLPPSSTPLPLPTLPKFLQDSMEEMCQGDGGRFMKFYFSVLNFCCYVADTHIQCVMSSF